MATSVQLEEREFNNGLLPPLRELFLEIQVNKLIQEYLFSSNAEETCTSLHEGSSSYKENEASFMPPNHFHAMDMAPKNAYNASCVKSFQALDDRNLHHLQTSQAPLTHSSIPLIADNGIGSEDQMVVGKALQATNTAHESSLATLSVESESKLMRKNPQLSRVGTFPCTGKVQLQVGTPSKVNIEMKASCKKPPRPPRVPKSEISSSFIRCCSDNGTYLQTSRRAKLERKRKATATSSPNTSIWALLFTLCFAIIMIAQGFWSQDSQNFTAYGRDASSPMATFVKASTKVSLEEPSLERMAEREASTEGVLAQSYVMRKVQSQHLSDLKHLKLDAS